MTKSLILQFEGKIPVGSIIFQCTCGEQIREGIPEGLKGTYTATCKKCGAEFSILQLSLDEKEENRSDRWNLVIYLGKTIEEEKIKPRLGDYVTAKLVKLGEIRQGVYVRNNHDGTVIIKGELETFLCHGPDELIVIPDNNLSGDTIPHVAMVREALGLQ